MPRPKRVWYPGAIYHVMSRGNRRLKLFVDEDDYLTFLEIVQSTREKYPFKVHAICLMTNHFHMAIETGQDELWKIMQKILHSYSLEFNHKYHFTGHLFESRYTSCLIENDQYFLEVSRYIHLNPVKAQIVREPQAYKYSSYALFVCDRKLPDPQENLPQNPAQMSEYRPLAADLIEDLVEPQRILAYFPDPRGDQYRLFVEGDVSHDEQEQQIQKEMREDDSWLPF